MMYKDARLSIFSLFAFARFLFPVLSVRKINRKHNYLAVRKLNIFYPRARNAYMHHVVKIQISVSLS